MRWKVMGADAGTGADVVREFNAATPADAESQARYNGILVSGVELIEPTTSAPQLESLLAYESKQNQPIRENSLNVLVPLPIQRHGRRLWKRSRRMVVSALAGIGLLAAIGFITLRINEWRMVSAIIQPPAPAPPPVVVRDQEPRITVHRTNFHDRLGETSSAIRIRSNEAQPLTILGVTFNGEFEAMAAREVDFEYLPDLSGRWPRRLTMGGVALAFEKNRSRPGYGYANDVLVVEVRTDRGTARRIFKVE